ncbi:MAG: DUF2652 domain-containing protein [Bacteroidota bacterium]
MAETNATILIPDISGFTEFMTTTELGHSSHAINILIDAMLNAIGEEYEVSEIEGDAVLLIKKGPAPSKKEIRDTCIRIFNAFHFQRKFMQLHTICPCGACQAIINLTLKFVVHHGPLAEIKIGRFVKQSGPEMIVAHRLLKNSIENHEYLLITEKLLQQVPDSSEPVEMEWSASAEEYASIGKVEYQFALLNDARKNVPEPPEPQNYYHTGNASHLDILIAANFRDIYMIVMNIPGRAAWWPGLQKVEQEIPGVFIGNIHHCTFESYKADVSPLQMTFSSEGIMYAESCVIKDMNVSLVYEFVFKKIDEKNSSLACRFINTGEAALTEDTTSVFFKNLQQTLEILKANCEKMEETFSESSIIKN